MTEARLWHKILLGAAATGRAGLGSIPTPCYSKARGKESRRLIQEEVQAEEEEIHLSRMVGMGKQGAWTKWEHAAGRKVTRGELWRSELSVHAGPGELTCLSTLPEDRVVGTYSQLLS